MDRFDIGKLRMNAQNFREDAMGRVEELISRGKIMEYIEKKKEDDKLKKKLLIALAVIGGIAAIAAIAYAVVQFVKPDYLEEYEEDDDVLPEA